MASAEEVLHALRATIGEQHKKLEWVHEQMEFQKQQMGTMWQKMAEQEATIAEKKENKTNITHIKHFTPEKFGG